MRDPVEVTHDETGATTTVPRGQVNALAKSGWRLVSAPQPVADVPGTIRTSWQPYSHDDFGLDES